MEVPFCTSAVEAHSNPMNCAGEKVSMQVEAKPTQIIKIGFIPHYF
jgi:hypothetical protein